MTKVVQTVLDEEEYRMFKEALEKKGLSIREGVKVAITKIIEEEFRVDPADPFFTRKPAGRSGVGDLSKKHDRYLYGERE